MGLYIVLVVGVHAEPFQVWVYVPFLPASFQTVPVAGFAGQLAVWVSATQVDEPLFHV
jgi:hypothetical protein